jgi:NADPH:quinone reductase-like Zn-dependent oxidoreductase
MRAALYESYGGVDRLQLREVENPGPPGTGQVLVRVRASSVNPLDWRIRQGQLRLILPAKFPLVPGFDLAGEVEAVGPEVTRFAPGDAVFGQTGSRHGGACAELALALESALAAKPEALSFEEAAAIPMGGLTALQALRDHGELAADERVLILGASGGVGHFAVQIAGILGARVAAVASGRNQDFLRELGAERTFDYQSEDFRDVDDTDGTDEVYEVIFDAAGKSSYQDCALSLASGGVYVTTEVGPGIFFAVLASRFRGWFGEDRRARMFWVKARAADLELLGRWVREGRLRPVLERVFPLEDIRQAHEASETGHLRGKIGVRIP